jgi:prepilin-type processing-associated H-X9-DG protein
LQFSLRRFLLLIAVVAVYLGITVSFGAFALGALPFVLFGGLIAFGLCRRRIKTTLLGFLIAMAAVYLMVSALFSGCVDPSGPASDAQCRNNLKQISIALDCYHERYGTLPPAFVADKNGRPMHSWRVLILPFMEQRALYDRYDFDEPWNGPRNSRLATVSVSGYCCPEQDRGRTTTSYVAVVGPETLWPGSTPVRFADVVDGTSRTVMVVEVANAGIHWMEPRDLVLSTMPLSVNPERRQGISSPHPWDKWWRPSYQSANVAMADGSVCKLWNRTTSREVLALLTIAGHEAVDSDVLRGR